MWERKWMKDYLSFNRSDRIAVLTLISLIILVFFTPRLLSIHVPAPASIPLDTAWIALGNAKEASIDPAPETTANSYSQEDRSTTNYPSATLFPFDPNTIERGEWKKLGLREKTIQTILNYRKKGGRFKTAADLSRIYGLKPDEFHRIQPYIRISGQSAPVAAHQPAQHPGKVQLNHFSPRYIAVDINLGDTTAFINLPGIGSKLAARIVSFREKLGGFYAIDQVGETFGLADSTFQKIRSYLKMEHQDVKKININSALLDELKTHPYIRYVIAKTIIAYRDAHGPFATLDELKKINTITDELFHKIAPYLTL